MEADADEGEAAADGALVGLGLRVGGVPVAVEERGIREFLPGLEVLVPRHVVRLLGVEEGPVVLAVAGEGLAARGIRRRARLHETRAAGNGENALALALARRRPGRAGGGGAGRDMRAAHRGNRGGERRRARGVNHRR